MCDHGDTSFWGTKVRVKVQLIKKSKCMLICNRIYCINKVKVCRLPVWPRLISGYAHCSRTCASQRRVSESARCFHKENSYGITAKLQVTKLIAILDAPSRALGHACTRAYA